MPPTRRASAGRRRCSGFGARRYATGDAAIGKTPSGSAFRLRELAASRVRFGYRQLTVLLRREGWSMNTKRIYRLHTDEGLIARTKARQRVA
jgi:putative transposase